MIALVAIATALIGVAAAQTASLDTIENSTIETTNETEYVELDIEFADSFNDTSEESVEFTSYQEAAWQDNGTEVGNYTGTLNGTTLKVQDEIHDHATYAVELNQSATTVNVNGTEFASDGTVDLTTVTADSITADDTVLSLTITADTVVTDTVTGGPSDTVNVRYQLNTTSFEQQMEYRVFVETGDKSNIQSGYVSPDDATIGGGFFDGDDAQPGFGVGVAIVAIAVAGVVARRRGS